MVVVCESVVVVVCVHVVVVVCVCGGSSVCDSSGSSSEAIQEVMGMGKTSSHCVMMICLLWASLFYFGNVLYV